MRRSKSDPARYAKNYRKISQRRMTAEPDLEVEESKLRTILAENERVIKLSKVNKEESNVHTDNTQDILSPEFSQQLGGDYSGDGAPLIITSKKRKQRKEKQVVITTEELKHAEKTRKKNLRKLKQLTERKAKKSRRADIYSRLAEHAISKEEMSMLDSSSTLGKSLSKKERLRRILQRQRANLPLTEEEREMLYVSVEVEGNNEEEDSKMKEEALQQNGRSEPTPRKGRKGNQKGSDQEESLSSTNKEDEIPIQLFQSDKVDCVNEDKKPPMSDKYGDKTAERTLELSFAEQMMANLASLKVKSDKTNKKLDKEREAEEKALEFERIKREEEEERNRKKYTPEAIDVRTAAAAGIVSKTKFETKKGLVHVKRPVELQKKRYSLPVCEMEFEILEAVRSNDAIILCGETGSGKSTQVPQFLYESGHTGKDDTFAYDMGHMGESGHGGMLIGVTQPRRVAAVSTAKRIAYELGCSDGQVIKNNGKGKGNLVAYQTRYETAGLGESTRIKVQTDGILLQEIRNDLLLRKYSVIVLDEAHERNLNTDVLLGLLSKSLPLRRKASEEGSLPPLKLIIMSATLRVEDFTANPALFPSGPPAVVRVPGRTHPVTIHHTKVTELEDYESLALEKVCKIHRKLPAGGILVFMTGKQEIITMVKKLRSRLGPKRKRKVNEGIASDVDLHGKGNRILNGPRDMDDDELDGEIFNDATTDDFDDVEAESSDEEMPSASAVEGKGDGGIKDSSNKKGDADENEEPMGVLVLPLYSMLSAGDQAKVFAPVPPNHRLIIVATNIAETSLTIPGISYVVDCGRHKCRNYHTDTGITSYDIMWISKAAADQRAGRSGRTGPGHCYRLYSSSLYSRHFDDFALPEVITRPLEDVVLAMKAMNISNVSAFPFPSPPDRRQVKTALHLLSDLGCVDVSSDPNNETLGDGRITKLGVAAAKLPLGVRYSKMMLVGAQANVLDYTIAIVAALSEVSPFVTDAKQNDDDENDDDDDVQSEDSDSLDDADRHAVQTKEEEEAKEMRDQWKHTGGDALSRLLAVGAYSYAGRGAGGVSEAVACKQFCSDNGMNFAVMQRIQKLRAQLAKLSQLRISSAEGVAATLGGILYDMPPPGKIQEQLLRQSLASGLLDHVARRAPPGSITGEHTMSLRNAYLGCKSSLNEPLFIDKKSPMYSRDSRQLPEWICYGTIVRKAGKYGSTIAVMTMVTPIDPTWLGTLSDGSALLSMGSPLDTPPPTYSKNKDAIMCSVTTQFGDSGWIIPPVQVEMFNALNGSSKKPTSSFMSDDSFRWFARFLLEGKVIAGLNNLTSMLNDSPSIITRKKNVAKVHLLVSALRDAGVDSAQALRKHWAERDSKFLFALLKSWTKKTCADEVKSLWIAVVKKSIKKWKKRSN